MTPEEIAQDPEFQALPAAEQSKVLLALPHFAAQDVGKQYQALKAVSQDPEFLALPKEEQAKVIEQIRQPALSVGRAGPAQIPAEPTGPQFGPARAMQGVSETLNPVDIMLKGLQAYNAPFQAASRAVGETFGEPARKSLQEDFGLGPTSSAAIATGLTLPARALLEILAPGKVAELVTRAVPAAIGKLGIRLSRTPGVAFERRQQAIKQFQTPEGEPGPLVTALKPPTPSEALYNQIGEANPVVPLGELKPVLQQIQKEEALAAGTGLEHPQTTRLVNQLDKKFFKETITQETSPLVDEFGKPITREIISGGKGETEFQQARLLMKRLNERIGRLKNEGGEEFGDALQVKKGFIKSLDTAAEGEVGTAWDKLRQANKAYKQELVYDKVSEIIGRKVRMLEGRPEAEAQNIASGQALKEIRQFFKEEPDLARALPPGSAQRIQDGLEKVRQLPLFPAPEGVSAGSQNLLRKVFMSGGIGGSTGAALGGAMGGAPGAAIGGGLGSVAYYKTADMITKSLAKPGGVQLVERMMRQSSGGPFTPEQLTALGTFISAGANR